MKKQQTFARDRKAEANTNGVVTEWKYSYQYQNQQTEKTRIAAISQSAAREMLGEGRTVKIEARGSDCLGNDMKDILRNLSSALFAAMGAAPT